MRVAVIGAGIGGLVTAAGLQADGHDLVVYEERDELGAVGVGLTLFGNAFAALDAIGLGDVVRGSAVTRSGGCGPGSGSLRVGGWCRCLHPMLLRCAVFIGPIFIKPS